MFNHADATATTRSDDGCEEPAETSRFLAFPGPPGAQARTQRVAVQAVRAGDSPRLAGESAEHARILAESGASLPPILVHRATMRVIDGMHRLRAAELRGDQTIEAEFFDGPDDDAFIAAVRANIAHGLPLTLADRQAAAGRILRSHPQYSDRSIAQIAGLAAGTVREIRRRAAPGSDESGATRIGRDGRVRPLDSAEARRLASDAIAQHPRASLREIARATGLSPSTVRDVRERMHRGEDPVPDGQLAEHRRRLTAADAPPVAPVAHDERRPPSGRRRAEPASGDQRGLDRDAGEPEHHPAVNRLRILENLRRDPSLRFTDSGRELLRALFARCSGPPGAHLLASLPPHCAYSVAALARACAQEWQEFADYFERWTEAGVADASALPERQ